MDRLVGGDACAGRMTKQTNGQQLKRQALLSMCAHCLPSNRSTNSFVRSVSWSFRSFVR